MNPDQTAPKWEQSDLVPYCLHYRLPKNISRREEQIKSCDCGKRFNNFLIKWFGPIPAIFLLHPGKQYKK